MKSTLSPQNPKFDFELNRVPVLKKQKPSQLRKSLLGVDLLKSREALFARKALDASRFSGGENLPDIELSRWNWPLK